MIISLALLLALLWQFYLGYSRGLVKQVYNFLATLVSLFVANHYYQPLADRLTLWIPYGQSLDESSLPFFAGVNIFEMDRVFYAGMAFVLAFLVSYLLLSFLGIFLHFLPLNRWDKPLLNAIAGGLSVLTSLIFISLFGNILATIPLDLVQRLLSGNIFIKGLISHFPVLSALLRQLWVTKILG